MKTVAFVTPKTVGLTADSGFGAQAGWTEGYDRRAFVIQNPDFLGKVLPDDAREQLRSVLSQLNGVIFYLPSESSERRVIFDLVKMLLVEGALSRAEIYFVTCLCDITNKRVELEQAGFETDCSMVVECGTGAQKMFDLYSNFMDSGKFLTVETR